MKKGVIFLCLLFGLFILNIGVVRGAGSYQLNFDGNTNYQVGDLVEVMVFINELKDIKGGLIGLQGTISYDETKLQYISFEGLYSASWTKYQPYTAVNGQIRYCDYDDTAGTDPILGSTPIMKITFKALKEGTTEIGFANNVRTVGSDIDFKTVDSILGLNKTINVVAKSLETIAPTTIISQNEVSNTTTAKVTNDVEKEENVNNENKVVDEEVSVEEVEETKEKLDKKQEKEDKKTIFQIIKTFFEKIFRR